jgi:hypothetical protein
VLRHSSPPRKNPQAGDSVQRKSPASHESRRMLGCHVLAVAAIWAVAFVAYSNSFVNRLIYDGFHLVLGDARVHAATSANVGLIWGKEYWYGTSTTGLYRPLTTFSFLFNYAILGNGPNPAGYHWVNFGLHAANILLVYVLAFTLFRRFPPAAAIAGLWGLHPVTVEAVANIAGRADLLAAAGVLGGLLCHIRAGNSISPVRKAAWLAALMSAAAIGIFSKENAIILPALMLVYDLAFRLPAKRPRAFQRELLPGYLAVAPPLMLFFALRARVLGQIPIVVNPFLENPLTGAGFWAGRITALKVLAKDLYLLLWPSGLSSDYSYNQIPIFSGRFDSWESWKAMAALAIWIAVLLIAVRVWRGNRAVFFFIAFFAVTILPTSNLIVLIGSIMAERFLYLPSIGFAGCLAAAVYAASGRLAVHWPLAGTSAPPILIAICLVFALRTWARNGDWFDEKTLWMHDVRVSPSSAKIHANLAEALWQEGRSFHDAASARRRCPCCTTFRKIGKARGISSRWASATGKEATRLPREAVILRRRAASGTGDRCKCSSMPKELPARKTKRSKAHIRRVASALPEATSRKLASSAGGPMQAWANLPALSRRSPRGACWSPRLFSSPRLSEPTKPWVTRVAPPSHRSKDLSRIRFKPALPRKPSFSTTG